MVVLSNNRRIIVAYNKKEPLAMRSSRLFGSINFGGLIPNESIISLIHHILSNCLLPARGFIEPARQEEIN
jgi:hypothetical protein